MNYIDSFIKKSIQEDIGDGDHTSIACIKKGSKGLANLIVKEDATIAGVELAKKIFSSRKRTVLHTTQVVFMVCGNFFLSKKKKTL